MAPPHSQPPQDTRPASSTLDLVFFDGACGLCHHTVRWLLLADAAGEHFRFAPLGGQRFEQLFDPGQRQHLPDSLVVRTARGRILVRAAAVAHLLQRLGGFRGLLGRGLGALPTIVGDSLYGLVARSRKHLFRRPPSTCPQVPPELAQRFDL